jgi:hypothetical protein
MTDKAIELLRDAIEFFSQPHNTRTWDFTEEKKCEIVVALNFFLSAHEQNAAPHPSAAPDGMPEEPLEDYIYRTSNGKAYVPKDYADALRAYAIALREKREGWVMVGELITIPDDLGTIFCAWNDKRNSLPAGTKIYAFLAASKDGK